MNRRLSVLALAAAGLLGFLTIHLRHFGWRPSALCDFGLSNLATDPRYRHTAEADFRDGFVLKKEGTGYDGQYYFFIACDPLASDRGGKYADPYFWQRVLHPLLACLLAGGDPARIPLAMAVVTLASILAGTWLLLSRVPAGSPACAWALAYALALGHLYGLQCSVGGPALSVALSVGAVLAWEKGRGGWCWLLLALALLARETAAFVALPLALWSFGKGRRRDALWVLASFLPFLAWQAWLRWRLGSWGMLVSGGHLTLPFLGFLRRAMSLKASGVDYGASARGMANNAVLLAFLGYAAWTVLDAFLSFAQGFTLHRFLYLANAGLFCCLGTAPLIDLNAATRAFLPAVPFLVLSRAEGRGGRIALAGGLVFSAAVVLKTALAHPGYVLWRS